MTSATVRSMTRKTFFLGVNTGFVREGLPDQRFLDFYARRASAELDCAIVGNVVIPGGFGSNAVTPRLTADAIWGDVASAIAEHGVRPGIQLATAWETYVGSRKFVSKSSGNVIASGQEMVSRLTALDLSALLAEFENGVAIALNHGFAHIQLHAAHGYLLGLLVDGRINPQADIVLDGLAKIANYLRSRDVESSIRISIKSGDKDFDSRGTDDFHAAIVGLDFDFVDLSSGYYNIDKRLIYPTRAEFISRRFAETMYLAKNFQGQDFILSGKALRYTSDDLPANIHLGICRDLIANPDVLRNPRNGCQNLNKCHYYSRGEQHLTCGRWAKDAMEPAPG
ncbi:hypothetical protein [uncultured Sphingomonas sp.]|uniref:hypothetical protein n=1 Tax=uncultured Sphingomonas sp. TaxID=158754 RepID=UPI0025D86D08|nr:hypothetical protein [uncultured Sphingomonas sp.]